jgi:hypothetical protein
LKNAAAQGSGSAGRRGRLPRDHPDVLDGVDPTTSPASSRLKTLQRVYQISPRREAMQALLGLGLTSAHDVAALPQEAFLERHADRFGSRAEAELVYRKAEQVSSVATNVVTLARTLDSATPLYGLSAPREARARVREALIRQFPTLETLFGSLDFCECEHCRSVLSPAAYLVDLLQFVDPEPPVWDNFLADWKERHNGETSRTASRNPDALVERRPDLPHIALTCENTHTALPYIDVSTKSSSTSSPTARWTPRPRATLARPLPPSCWPSPRT